MTKANDIIRFKAKLLRPAQPKGAAWTFLVLPAEASAKLPARSQVTVDGTLDGHSFQATLEPDGQGSHWLKVGKTLREAAGAAAGAMVALEMTAVENEPEPKCRLTCARGWRLIRRRRRNGPASRRWRAATGSTGSLPARRLRHG